MQFQSNNLVICSSFQLLFCIIVTAATSLISLPPLEVFVAFTWLHLLVYGFEWPCYAITLFLTPTSLQNPKAAGALRMISMLDHVINFKSNLQVNTNL